MHWKCDKNWSLNISRLLILFFWIFWSSLIQGHLELCKPLCPGTCSHSGASLQDSGPATHCPASAVLWNHKAGSMTSSVVHLLYLQEILCACASAKLCPSSCNVAPLAPVYHLCAGPGDTSALAAPSRSWEPFQFRCTLPSDEFESSQDETSSGGVLFSTFPIGPVLARRFLFVSLINTAAFSECYVLKFPLPNNLIHYL